MKLQLILPIFKKNLGAPLIVLTSVVIDDDMIFINTWFIEINYCEKTNYCENKFFLEFIL